MRIFTTVIGLNLIFGSVLGIAATPTQTSLPPVDNTKVTQASASATDDASESDDSLKAVQLYSQNQLLDLIAKNKHLARVKADRCQLVQDIKQRAEKIDVPAYQFLWGDMLAWGVCVPKNAKLGVYYMRQAARQGLPAALEQLGRYYAHGILMQANPARGIQLLRESASLGFLRAKIEYVELLVKGYGSPYDYKQAYQWLFNAVIADPAQHRHAGALLAQLAQKMPPSVVDAAKENRENDE